MRYEKLESRNELCVLAGIVAPYAAFPDKAELAKIFFIVDQHDITEYRGDKEEESRSMKTTTALEEKI
jgi:hypothetical protein